MSDAKAPEEQTHLEQLAAMTTVVADTGELDMIRKYRPTDATTNPSLMLAASGMEQYQHLIDDAVTYGKSRAPAGASQQDVLDLVLDKLAVNFGCEILKIVPGYVSTEVDASLSFDIEGNVTRARRIISLYEEMGVSRERVLIKLASTWEGIRAAEQLEREGIHCNMTLLFCFAQAVAAADAGATLISPFVGRILDWFKKATGKAEIPAAEDPGVLSVTQIYRYYKKYGYSTIVMGASFRNVGEILALGGCDRLTIAPKLLEELSAAKGPIERVLKPETSGKEYEGPQVHYDEKTFRWLLNEDAMATEKLAEGIRNFNKDLRKLEDRIRPRLA